MFETTEKKVVRAYVVNAAVCDATGVQEESLQGYDAIVVNAATLITSPRAQALFAKYPVTLNVAGQYNVEAENVEIATVNGRSQIGPGSPVPARPTLLMVNGTLEIAPGAEEAIKGYCGFLVNGKVICPESMTGLLSGASVNGKIESYPDDSILLKRTVQLDRTFALRARPNAKYYAGRCIVALDPEIDFEKLAAKHVTFATKEVLVAEGLAESALPLFDERADVSVLPDGCAFVPDDAALDEALVLRYGSKLYIDGDLKIDAGSAPWLERVEYLRVKGSVRVTRDMVNAFRAVKAEYGELRVVAGLVLSDRVSIKVDRAMLEQAADGLQLEDCVNVKIAKDVPPELIAERLVALNDCVHITCTEAQRSAVELVANDAVSIRCTDSADAGPDGEGKKKGMLSGIGEKVKELTEALGLDMDSVDLVKSVMGSRIVNGSTCRL